MKGKTNQPKDPNVEPEGYVAGDGCGGVADAGKQEWGAE